MKKIFMAATLFALLFACTKKEKNETKETSCPTIAATLVPQAVVDSFARRYTPDVVITWFRKDSVGYCAYFKQGGTVKKLAEFNNTGMFLREETEHDSNHDGNSEDSTGVSGPKTTTGCECEIPE